MTNKILIIDDEADIRDVLADIFTDEGYSVLKAAHSEQAFQIIEQEQPNLIVLDIWLENSDLDGIGILKQLKKDDCVYNNIPVLMISGHGNIEMAVKAMKIGAYDFIEKPFKIEHILLTAERALEQHHLIRENTDLKHRVYNDITDYKTKSALMQSVLKTINDDCMSDARVLVMGDIGTGKSKLARYIHQVSNRSDSPLFTIKGKDIDKDIIDEWFSHAQYSGSTILIEQIESLQKSLHPQLLRHLSENSGSDVPRFICTSSKILKTAIDRQEFSSALFDRLAILKYVVPKLSDRIEDFDEMSQAFALNICQPMNVPVPTFAPDAISFLQNQPWPGNIAQFKCFVELAALNHSLGKESLNPITAKTIAAPLTQHTAENTSHNTMFTANSNDNEVVQWLALPLRDARENFETLYLSSVLNRFRGNISQMAGHVDMERTALHRKLKSMDIKYNDTSQSKAMEH